MALTVEQILGQVDPNLRGAEAADPSFVGVGGADPVRPIAGTAPLPRLQAPTVGERIGEALIKGMRARYERIWAETSERMQGAYATDQARLEALAAEEDSLLQHLYDIDKELHEVAVARAGSGAASELEQLDSMGVRIYEAQIAQEEAIARDSRERAELALEAEETVRNRYQISRTQDQAVNQLVFAIEGAAPAGSDPATATARFAETLRGAGELREYVALLRSETATDEQRTVMAGRLQEVADRLGVDPAVARREISKITGAVPMRGDELAAKIEADAAEAGARARRGGMRRIEAPTGAGDGTSRVAGTDRPATPARAGAADAEVVNAWARTREGQLALAALSDGTITAQEAAKIAEEVNTDPTAIPATGADVLRRVDLARAVAAEPTASPLVSTQIRRAVDPRRLEAQEALRALREEEATIRSRMVLPDRQAVREGTEQRVMQERGARRPPQGAAIQAAMPDATPAMQRFALASWRALRDPEPARPEPVSDQVRVMLDAYRGGGLRDPEAVVAVAVAANEKDPDAILVPYLREIQKRQKKMGIQPDQE